MCPPLDFHFCFIGEPSDIIGRNILLAFLFLNQQGVALMGRNRTGPPCSVGRPTAHMSGGGQPPTHLAAGSVTDDRRQ